MPAQIPIVIDTEGKPYYDRKPLIVLHANFEARDYIEKVLRGERNTRRKIQRRVNRSAADMVLRMKERVLELKIWDTGKLYMSIDHHRENVNEHVVYVGVHYGIFVEEGTVTMARRPFFFPVLYETEDELEDKVTTVMEGFWEEVEGRAKGGDV